MIRNLSFELVASPEQVMKRVGRRISELSDQDIDEIKERNKLPSISNLFNMLNGKSVTSLMNYQFIEMAPFFYGFNIKNVITDLTLEDGEFRPNIFGKDCILYRKTNLEFPEGLELKNDLKIPPFGIEVLAKNSYPRVEVRRRDYFLGFVNNPANFKHIIPTREMI